MEKINVILPKWGLTMEEGTLVEWRVSEGEKVKAGQVLAVVETDKVTNELEAPVDGTISALLYPAGDEAIKVGETLCTIEADA